VNSLVSSVSSSPLLSKPKWEKRLRMSYSDIQINNAAVFDILIRSDAGSGTSVYLSEQNDTANGGGGGVSRAGQRAVTERNNSQQRARTIMHTEAWRNN
jgi:hypothetical protein